jgi:hypothetical protein
MEATRKVRGLQVVAHERSNGDPVEEHTMVCLRQELSNYGLEHLALIRSGEITIADARTAIWVKAAVSDSVFDLNPGQFEELMKIGFRSAGVLREQLARAS